MLGLRRNCRLQTEILVQSRRLASFRPVGVKFFIMIFGIEIQEVGPSITLIIMHLCWWGIPSNLY